MLLTFHLGIVVPPTVFRLAAILDSLFGAAVNAGHTMLTVMQPFGTVIGYADVPDGADLFTQPTADAMALGKEGPVQFLNIFIEVGRNDPAPFD